MTLKVLGREFEGEPFFKRVSLKRSGADRQCRGYLRTAAVIKAEISAGEPEQSILWVEFLK